MPEFNGRFYDVLTGATSYADAVSRAASITYNGMTGYLATINSMEEYAFIHWNMSTGSVWLSGTDLGSEGTWKYSSSSLSGSNVAYLPWALNEPNGRTSENCLYHWAAGLADISCSNNSIPNFVVEFECVSPRILVQGACIRMPRMWHFYLCVVISSSFYLQSPHATATSRAAGGCLCVMSSKAKPGIQRLTTSRARMCMAVSPLIPPESPSVCRTRATSAKAHPCFSDLVCASACLQ